MHKIIAVSLPAALIWGYALIIEALGNLTEEKRPRIKIQFDEVVGKIRAAHKARKASIPYLLWHIIPTDLQFVVFDPDGHLDVAFRNCLYQREAIYISSKAILEAPEPHEYSKISELQVHASYLKGEEHDYLVFFRGALNGDNVRSILRDPEHCILCVEKSVSFLESSEYVVLHQNKVAEVMNRVLDLA
jgi:hypothetical protein